MRKLLLAALFAIFCISFGNAQEGGWRPVDKKDAGANGEVKESLMKVTGGFFLFDAQTLRQPLAGAGSKESGAQPVVIAIPDVNGNMEQYAMYESSNFAPELQAQYPEIRAYAGNSLQNPSAVLRLSLSPRGLSGMVLREAGKTEFIEQYTSGTSNVYIVFNAEGKRERGRLPFTCLTKHDSNVDAVIDPSARRASDLIFRTYRLALSCNGEYTQYHANVAGVSNGTDAQKKQAALAAMNATMTRVNGVFERDLAVKLIIIANNDSVIYTNANTDPYTGMGSWASQLNSTLTSVIGEANYDIGHFFGASGGGGSAGSIGNVCINGFKDRAYTSPGIGGPEGDFFDIDYVAHEMGHQMGANHTFTYTGENNPVNVEPGSGSTIMAYAGLGEQYNVQLHSDDYFTYRSIWQIQNYLNTQSCGTTAALTNPAITVTAPAAVTIPRGTAFVLRAVNPEANLNTVTYTWEQDNDATTSAAFTTNSFVSPTKTNGPNFRSVPPTTSGVRYMPNLTSVIENNLTPTTLWETVNTNARQLNFALTGRDNVAGGGQTKTDFIQINVSSTVGPFTVTSQNTANVSWAIGSTQTITWNVANTTNFPVSTSNVNIKLSLDGGLTYPVMLAENTPNDGSQSITVPAVSGTNCRVMVEAVGNIFYALNTTPFKVGLVTACTSYPTNTPFAVQDGTGTSSSVIGPIYYSNQVVTGTGTIADVNVSVNLQHTSIRDILMAIRHPDNTVIFLWQNQCGSQDNFNITFNDGSPAVVCAEPTTGTYAPSSALSALNGKGVAGTWSLMIADGYAGNTGQVLSWNLEICAEQAAASTEEFAMQDLAIYPNPNNGNFTVSFTSGTGEDIKLGVYDMRGRQVMQKSYANTGAFSGNINLDNVQAGVYLVTVEDGANRVTKKIVVQ
ncbi:M12 family metallo-peptidase [Flavobacterium sp. J372]|uniref:zinc-dependent metalloprotease n=1 Tax=Flavobacterium sp. J372 TaxID=2898436 RepID=UPI0021516135|nr:zinc-dependent metalloprotease family protein [Flavobacterium sp. J372]MCR5861300.1 M12 family metallo-peptidase [Flavobacterium sp. J372]